MESAREIPHFPEEVVAEILSWLPVKPLLRFRCVSKIWCSLIDSKQFVISHLEKSGRHPSFAQHRIIVRSREPSERFNLPFTLRHFSLPSLLNEHTTNVSEFDDPLGASNDMRVVGSCDGLICVLSDTNKFFLWNPSTRIFRQLPFQDDEVKSPCILESGFGLDESTGDYKVFCSLLEKGYGATGKVYSLNTNSWRRIKYAYRGLHCETGRFVSGKLHWLGRSCDDSDSRMNINTFDLEKEENGMIQLPFQYHIDYNYDREMSLTMGIVEECLCVLYSNLRSSKLDIWVMKQYGVKESWTKVMTIPYLFESWESTYLMPLFLGQNGEILLVDWPSFLVYNPKDKRAWKPLMRSPYDFCNSHVYIESLVSPVSSGEQ